jgi:hypothetical protein
MKIFFVSICLFFSSHVLVAEAPLQKEDPAVKAADKIPTNTEKSEIKQQGELVDGILQRVGKSRLILQSDITAVAKELKWRKFPEELLYPALPSDPSEKQALEYLTNEHLITMACEENQLVVESEQIESQLKSVIKSNPNLKTEEDLAEALKAEGKTLDDFRQEITSQMNMRNFSQRFVIPYIKVTEADLRPYYFLKTGEKAESISVKVEQVIFSCSPSPEGTCSEGDQAYKRLLSGSSLKEVSESFSQASSVEQEEYDLNSLASETMKEALENLEVGQYTKPVPVDNKNVYIFKLIAKKVTPSLGFDSERLKVEYMQELSAAETKLQLKKLRIKHNLPIRQD